MARTTDPDGLIAAAVKKWKGDPMYAPGQIVNGRLICGAKKKNEDPCGASPAKGATRCGRHGGAAQQVKAKAEERVMEDNARTILGRIDPTAPREHPVETLLNMIHAKYAEVAWLRGRVQSFTEEELTWGKVEHREGIGPEGPVDVRTHRADVNVWWKLLREAENQLANWITMALKAGVEERRVKLAEEQGTLVATAVRSILNALNLTPEQQQLVPVVVPQALRALSTETA